MRINLTQAQRAVSLLIDLVALLTINYLAFFSFAPHSGDKGFWFYTAVIGVLLGTKLVTPFFAKPVDAFAYSVPAFLALMLTNQWSSWQSNAQIAFVVSLTITGLIGICSLLAILLNGWGVKGTQEASNRLRQIVESVAIPQVLYSSILIFSMVAYHYESPRELVAVATAMLMTTVISIGDLSIKLAVRLRLVLRGVRSTKVFGIIAAYQKPGIYLLRSESLDESTLPTPILLRDSLTGFRFALAVDTVGRESGHLCRAIELTAADDDCIDSLRHLPLGASFVLGQRFLEDAPSTTKELFEGAKRTVGLVAADSGVSRLFIEVTRNEELTVGRLVSVTFSGNKVLYQLVGGLTREEAVHQKNTYGYVRAQAQQVGIWKGSKLAQCRWLPEMHSPVGLESETTYQMTAATIGRFPGTNYTAEIRDINQLVTHNTAILGILGVGKSMLAIELVERMLSAGIKVICLDLTSQYRQELSEFYCEEIEARSLAQIRAACDEDRNAIENDPEAGGSLPNLRKAVQADLAGFLSADCPRMLKIYNPADFTATHQEFEPKSYQEGGRWHRAAGLYSVTPVQATQIISEAALRELLPVSQTPSLGVMMKPEVANGKENLYPRVQA